MRSFRQGSGGAHAHLAANQSDHGGIDLVEFLLDLLQRHAGGLRFRRHPRLGHIGVRLESLCAPPASFRNELATDEQHEDQPGRGDDGADGG